MNKRIVFLLIFLSGYLFLSAQESVLIKGKVIDGSTKGNVAFVNIGIEGTLLGTASNAEGDFSFKVQNEFSQKNLYFSAIGYQNLIIPIQQFLAENKTISLQALSYGINDVEISTQSKVLYRIVREAINLIPHEFIHGPFSVQALYQNEVYTNQILGNKRDAMIEWSDETGYASAINTFKRVNYKFLNVQRNFEVKSLSQGTTLLDELLSLDLARNLSGVLNPAFLNDYDLDLNGSSTINGDSVWIIAYRLSKPNLSRSGDLYATISQGKLYISKEKKVLLKVEALLQSPLQSPQGRTVAVEASKALNNVNYRFSTSYKFTPKGYLLDRISLIKTYKNDKGEPSKNIASLFVLDLNTTNPEMISKRQYFENMLSDPDFWVGLAKE
ncbi:MAG: carboxypeptidase-like regulatory domain-containing protein [Prolixibacteraceae bacterium]